MRATTEHKVTVKIELEHDEARWLLGYLQNSPQGLDENESDHYTRCDMFETLKESLTVSRPEPPLAPVQPPVRVG